VVLAALVPAELMPAELMLAELIDRPVAVIAAKTPGASRAAELPLQPLADLLRSTACAGTSFLLGVSLGLIGSGLLVL
jgi:hypothetical protein